MSNNPSDNTVRTIISIVLIVVAFIIGFLAGGETNSIESNITEDITAQQYREQSLQYLEDIRELESEQRDILWCIHESTASGVDMCPPTSMLN